MKLLEKLTPSERVVAWRLATGRSVRLAELVSALYSHDPDGGPLGTSGTIGQFVFRLQRKFAPHGVTIWSRCSAPHLGYLVPASDLARFRDLLADEIDRNAHYDDVPRSRANAAPPATQEAARG